MASPQYEILAVLNSRRVLLMSSRLIKSIVSPRESFKSNFHLKPRPYLTVMSYAQIPENTPLQVMGL